jgi:hypothetical protein
MTGETAQIRDDALDVLADVLEWSLAPARWAEVEAALATLVDRPDLADPDQAAALSDATIRLELAGPARISRIDTSAVPVPAEVRERVNHLVHELTRPGQAGNSPADSSAGT